MKICDLITGLEMIFDKTWIFLIQNCDETYNFVYKAIEIFQ